jgi:broad specificity phosphatase PhoE
MGKAVRTDNEGLPIPSTNGMQTDTLEIDNEGLPVPQIKKKDAGGPASKASPSGSTPTPTSSGQQPIASGSELPQIKSDFGIFGFENKKQKITTADGFDMPADHNKLPDFIADKEKYTAEAQKRVLDGSYTSADIDTITKVTGKSRKAVEGYLKDKSLGLATEDQEQLQQKNEELKQSIVSYNKEMGTTLDPKDILSSSQKTADFIQQVQRAKKTLLAKEAQRVATLKADPNGVTYSMKNGQIVTTPNKDLPLINLDPQAFINKYADYEKVLQDHAVKLTIDEDRKAGVAPDKTVVKIAQRLDPVGMARAQKVENTPKGLDAISDTDINPFKALGHVAESVFGTKEKDDLLNSIKGEAELKYQNGLRELAINKISTGIINTEDPKSKELIKEGQEQLKQVDDNAIYKYPALVKREIARAVSERIGRESGQLEGSSVESLRGLEEKIHGASREDYVRVMQEMGYFDNPKTKDAAEQLVGQTELFSDASYVGSFGSSVMHPIKDLGYSLGDITGYRNARDVYTSKISDELFPKETAKLKDHVAVVRNIVNTTGNLIGMTALAVGTEGLGTEVGMSAKAAGHLGSYVSFGIPSFDAAYKESYNFLDNDAARGLYATMTAITNAEGGRLLDLGKVARIPGVSDAFAKVADGITKKTISQDAVRELLGEQTNKYVDFAVKYGKNVTKGAATMAYFNATNSILKAGFGDPSVKADDILPQTAHAFFGGLLGMSIMGAWGAAADMRKEANTTYKGGIYSMALNHDAAADVFKIALDNGSLTKAEYTNKMSVLNGAKMAKDVVELAAQEKELNLTHDQKAVFVANKTVEGVLKEKLKNTQGEKEKEKIQSQIDRLHNQSNEIFDGLKFNEVLEPLYDLHNAEKEYNKALQDVKLGVITDKEFEAKKKAFEKLQYNYFEGGMEKDAKNNEVKRLLTKGIESGEISDTYKAYEQHPEHLLKFIAGQSQGLVEDADGNVTKHPIGGNEAGMRAQFGDALVDHALESHPLPSEFKEPEAKPQPIIVRHAEAEEPIVPGEPENKNPQLTDSGKKQAEQLGKDFKEKGVIQIVSSPVDRSLHTANIAAKESGASVKQDERLAEYDPLKESLDEFANRVNSAMTDLNKLGSETAVVTHGKVLGMIEALEKNKGDIEAAKKDFENSKEYDNTEAYVPPSGVSVIQPGDIPNRETTTISPEEKPISKEAQAYRDSAARLRIEGDEEGANKLDEEANLLESGAPPIEKPPVTTPSQTPPEQWSAIRKEKLLEIEGAGKVFEEQTGKPWSETHKTAMANLQAMYPDKNVYDAAKARATEIATKYDLGQIYNPTSEDLAVLQYLKAETDSRINNTVDRMASEDQSKRTGALLEYEQYKNDLITIAKAANPQEAGRAFNIRQLEAKVIDENNGLQIRRMDFMKAKGGEKLTAEEMEWTANQWEKEKDVMRRDQELKEKGMQEAFDKQMQQLQRDYEKKLKDVGKEKKAPTAKTERTLSQKGKEVADKLRKGLKSDKGTLQADITLGLKDLAVEAVAKLIEGTADIAQAIVEVLKDAKFKGLTKEDLTNHILGILDRQENKAAAFEKIKDHAELNKVSDVTTDMVSKNFIRDYVNAHIGESDPKDVLDAALNELKTVLPDVTKEKLREAYLKEGEFKQPSRKDLETQYSKDRKELLAITKLEEDIDDLKAEQELKVRGSKGEREKGEHETKLINEKDELLAIKDRSEKEQKRLIELNSELERIQARREKEKVEKKPVGAKEVSDREQEILDKIKDEQDRWDAEKKAAVQAKEDYRKLETERNRQIAVVDKLNEKKKRLLASGEKESSKKGEVTKDTPEIEAAKKEIKEIEKQISEGNAEVKRIEREQERENDKGKKRILKIAEMDAKIRRLKERGELIKEHKKKDPEEIDKAIQAAENRLKKTLNDKGLKVSSEDKYAKSGAEARAKTHNDRLDTISNKIQDRIDKGDLSTDQKEALSKLKAKLDGAKIKLDENSALSNDPIINQGLELLKKAKSEFDRESGIKNISVLGEFKKDLQKAIDGFNNDKSESEQDIKLQRTKDQLRQSTAETQRKINAGEFEDKPIVALNKSDAELVKLQIEKNKVESEYRKRQQEIEDKNKSKLKQAAELLRASYVAALIWKFGTLAKVATMAVVRPTVEATTKLTGGKIFDTLFPSISTAAKRGGESTSIRSIAKSYEAQFAHYGEKKMQEIYDRSNKKYEESEKQYNDYIPEHEKIKEEKGTDSIEFKQSERKLQDLKDKRDGDMLSAVANFAYQFIGGSSIQDALSALIHRSNKIEKEFGDFNEESFKDGTAVDKINYVIGFIGRSHSALKTFSGRASFVSGFVARMEGALADGVDITKSDKIMEIANDSYLDWDRGKYQQSNFVTDTMNKISQTLEKSQEGKPWEKYAKATSFFLKLDLPITRVPVNILHESVVEYTAGFFKATFMAANAYRKANNEIKMSENLMPGEKEFKDALRERVQGMDATQAATIARCFRKGSFGLGIFALVSILGVAQFGGFYAKGQKKKKPDQLEEGELNPGEIMIGKTKQGELLTKIIEHTPALYPSLFAANMIKVYKDNVHKGTETWEGAGKALMANLEAMQDAIPQTKILNPIGVSEDAGKGALRSIGKAWEPFDVDADGNLIERKPFDFKDQINLAIGRRGEVLTEENYKQAAKVANSYKKEIQAAYKEGQTKERIETIKKERDEAIDEIYRLNKEENPSK